VEASLINHNIQAFIMALIWGFGAQLMADARDKYSVFVQDMLNENFFEKCDFSFKKRVQSATFPVKGKHLFSIFYNLDS